MFDILYSWQKKWTTFINCPHGRKAASGLRKYMLLCLLTLTRVEASGNYVPIIFRSLCLGNA
jgi:hypothetical protein